MPFILIIIFIIIKILESRNASKIGGNYVNTL